jgi:hypothetical protein
MRADFFARVQEVRSEYFRANARSKFRGDIMGMGTVPASESGFLGMIGSSSVPWLPVAYPSRFQHLAACNFHSIRLASCVASAFTTGIRGKTPPPLG